MDTWQIIDDADDPDTGASFTRDEEILADVRADRQPATMRIWRTGPCIAATAQEAARPGFARGARELAARGWPVLLRRSGGSAVPLTRGILNLSLIYAIEAFADASLATAYSILCRPLLETLRDCGIEASIGPVGGSFCDGRYNLVVNGRKIAGTAQRWSAGRNGGRLILSQGMLIIDGSSLSPGIAAINRLYETLALPQRVDAACCVGVDQLQHEALGAANESLIAAVRERLLARCRP